jgi:xylulokinase
MAYIIGVDIGTQGIKAVLLDEDLKLLKKVYSEHNLIQPRPNWVEHDAEQTWWVGFKNILKRLTAGIETKEVIGVGCSAITPCMLPTDDQGRPLRNSILYGIDTRSKDEVDEMNRLLGEEQIYEISKQPLSTQSVGPKILWFKKNEPLKFKRTQKIFTSTNYLTYKLTGNFVLDYGQASSFAPFYNFNEKRWEKEIIERFDLPFELFPHLKNSSEIAGTVTKEAAKETGLKEGTPVIVSTGDALAEILSLGGFGKGEVTLLYGTTGIISITTDKFIDIKNLFITHHPIDKELYIIVGATATSAALTRWFRDNFGEIEKIIQQRNEINAYELLSEQARHIPPGSDGLMVLPYFNGERSPINDPLARGVILGLTTYHTRPHIYRALLEGTAYSFRHHFEILEDNGIKVNKVIAGGGGTKSDLWVEIVSDVLGYDQIIPNITMGAEIGVAYLVAKAIGLCDDYNFIQNKLQTAEGKVVRTSSKNHNIYNNYYKVYRNLYGNIKDQMHQMALLSQQGKERIQPNPKG